MTRFDPTQVGWRLGRSHAPHGGQLWVPFDRTTGVYGPQGCGKTLDLLTPALLAAPGAALVTLTKLDDLLLTMDHRSSRGSPVAVLDPFGTAPGVPELVWDPVSGCVDSMVAERRAKAFTAGTVKGAVAGGTGDDAARFYAAEGAKVLQAFFHAAALTGRTLDHVLEWVANPANATAPEEILRTHPHAAQFWHGLLRGALHGDDRTAGNTATTVQQAMSLFFQEPIRRRCVPGPGRPATDITDLITAGGTIYMLGRDDPYASASPLMTALAEHVLDTALGLANQSPWGRLCPSFLACLDELPSTTPLPTLRTRMANERALGISFIYAAQTWRQLVICYGEDEARTLFGLTNNVVVFGGGKDGHFYREISDLVGTTRVTRTSYNTGRGGSGRTTAGEDTPVLRPEEIRQLAQGRALVIAENARPLIAKLHRCIEGKAGKRLLADQAAAREIVGRARGQTINPAARTTAAVAVAQQMDLHATAVPGSHNSLGGR
jgi:type IV secretion system protein VirD4